MSRPLLGLVPNAYMSKRQVVSWEIEKQKTRVILKKALDNYPSDRDPTDAEELALVNAVLSLLNLFAAKLPAVKEVTQYHQDVTIHMPDGSTTTISIKGRQKEARASAPHGPDGEDLAHMDAYSIRDRELTREADADVKAAERAIRIGREYRVSQILSSNGVAPRTVETADILRTMHPTRILPLNLPAPTGPQLKTPREDCFKTLMKNAGSIRAPIDALGFSDDALVHDRGQPKESTLSWYTAILQELLGAGRAPDAVYFLLVSGSLTAINKDTREETAARLTALMERRLRPVNSGSGILKTPLRVALGQEEAMRAIEELLPLQMGNGLRAGPQIKVYLARLLYEAGHFVSLQDAMNAFNAMLRQAALDATKELWPESTLLINKIYGPKAACLYLYKDDDDNTHVAVMLSEEGSRMGCVMGGTIFNICMHVRVYRQMMIKYPMTVQRALTDDLSRFAKPAEGSSWDESYTREAEALLYYDALANPIGIYRHPDKGKILLPANAPDPRPDHPLLALTKVSRSAASGGRLRRSRWTGRTTDTGENGPSHPTGPRDHPNGIHEPAVSD